MAEAPLPIPVGWEDDYQLAFPSRFLGRQHLRGQDVTLTITKVDVPELAMVKAGQRPQRKRRLVIEFDSLRRRNDGTPHEWIVNKTNAGIIAMLYGKRPLKDWVGKRITLYDDPTVEAFGQVVGAIRVRPKRPESRQRPAQGGASSPTASSPSPGPAGPPSQEEIDEIMRREQEDER